MKERKGHVIGMEPARPLGFSRNHLRYRIEKYGLRKVAEGGRGFKHVHAVVADQQRPPLLETSEHVWQETKQDVPFSPSVFSPLGRRDNFFGYQRGQWG